METREVTLLQQLVAKVDKLTALVEVAIYPPEENLRENFVKEVEEIKKGGTFKKYPSAKVLFAEIERGI